MARIRLRIALVVLALAGVPLAVVAPAEAAGAEQTITFSTRPPTDAIYDRIDGLGGYVPKATSSSGLPVTYSVSSAEGVCSAVPGALGSSDPDAVTVFWSRPGICLVHADQAGDSEFAPARRVTQVLVVKGEETALTPARVNKGLLGLTPSVFRATLAEAYRFGPGIAARPFVGATVRFHVAGRVACTAVTDAQGVATCTAKIGPQAASRERTYAVDYLGDTYHQPSRATGRLVSLVG